MARKCRVFSFVLLFALCGMLVGCLKTGGDVVRQGGTQEPKISYDVVKEAQVTSFKCYVGQYNKEKTLIHKVTIKNVSDKNHRYRIVIAIPNGDVVGGLLPATAKEKFEPGKERSAEYPVIGQTQVPGEIEISVVLMD
jgi:hypothetical protein